MKSLAAFLGAAALCCLASVPAAHAGTKTVNNNTPDTIHVTIIGRGASCTNNSGVTHATIPANSSQNVTYSTTFMNKLTIALKDSSTASNQSETLGCTATGGSGTLDNAFNANSTFEIGISTGGTYGITFSSHN